MVALHVFAMALPVGSDGGVLAGRMAAHTANAGCVYCASGAFDRDDIIDGRFDADANMAREVAEETGLDLRDAEAATGYRVLVMERTSSSSCAFTALPLPRRNLRSVSGATLRRRRSRNWPPRSPCRGTDEVSPQFAPHMAPVLAWQFAGR